MKYIYTITDPRDNNIFYVGQTKDPKQRFYYHLSGPISLPRKIIDSIIKDKFN